MRGQSTGGKGDDMRILCAMWLQVIAVTVGAAQLGLAPLPPVRLREVGQAGGERVFTFHNDGFVFTGQGKTLELWDDTGPEPERLDQIRLSHRVLSVSASGDFLYVTTTNGLAILVVDEGDFGEPYLEVVSGYEALGIRTSILLSTIQHRVLMALGRGGITLPFNQIDFVIADNPLTLEVAGPITGIGVINDLESWTIGGQTIMAAMTSQGLYTYDVSDVATPVPLDSIPVLGGLLAGAHSPPLELLAVIQPGVGIRQVDVSDPADIDFTGTAIPLFGSQDIDWAESLGLPYLYSANGFNQGWTLHSLANPDSPELIVQSPQVGITARIIDTAPNRVSVGNRDLGVTVFDMTVPASPSPEFVFRGFNTPRLAIGWDRVYASAYSGGVQAYHLPPDAEGQLAPAGMWPGSSQAIDALGMFVYSLTSTAPGSLQVLDASNPPAQAGAFNTPGFRLDVDILDHGGAIGRVGYITDGNAIRTVDVDDPANITPLDTFTLSPPSFALNSTVAQQLSLTHAYVCAGPGGMQILNATDPADLTPLGTFPSTAATDIAIKDTWGFLADGISGVRVLDLADPMMPVQEGVYDTPDSARAVSVSGEFVFVADTSSLIVLNVSNPQAIQLVSQVPSADGVEDVDLWNDFVVIADGRGGVRVFEFGRGLEFDADIGDLLLGTNGDRSGLDLNGDGRVGPADIVTIINEQN
ncbi:MAG: hypothetical protein HUU25_07740 [Candidatus Sumerlaeia bacterium]|nr:hypothetical protein [Candidatus Sumerlaeia bacterium]